MILYRPTGLEELRLIYAAHMRAWPARLPEQPIFYPVLSHEYAGQIARDWNARTSEQVGYVTRFSVSDRFTARFPVQVVGGREHQELWIPADAVAELNANLDGPIELVDAFFGPAFSGLLPTHGTLAGRSAVDQVKTLAALFAQSHVDFLFELTANKEAVFLHFPFWAQCSLGPEDLSSLTLAQVMDAICRGWRELEPETPLWHARPAA